MCTPLKPNRLKPNRLKPNRLKPPQNPTREDEDEDAITLGHSVLAEAAEEANKTEEVEEATEAAT